MRSLTLAVLVSAMTTSLGAADGTVTVVHGIPGVTVDVYVNGDLTLPGFEPETVTDPIDLPGGTYDLAVTLPGGDIGDAILTGSVELAAGANASIVAHLDEGGDPTLSVFANDLSEISDRKGRLVIRHVAAAPAVDVRLFRWIFRVASIRDLSNGEEGQLDLRARSYRAAIFAAGTRRRVAGPVEIDVERRQSLVVYAIGSLGDGTFDLVTQTIDIPETGPAKVTVVHGVPGLVVDVYVNGELTLPGFEPETITDPLPLPAGDYEIAITASGDDIANAVITGSATLGPAMDVSLVAHLAGDGSPALSAFVNDRSPTFFLLSRIVVRHTAAAPTVDVELMRRRSFRHTATLNDLSNGEEGSADVFLGRYQASIFPAGGDEPVFGPVDLTLPPGRSTTVYAIGSLEDGTFTVLANPRRLSFGRIFHFLYSR